MELTIEQRVANGAAFLDLHVVGWDDRLNVDTLDVGSCWRCVVGQLFFGYSDGIRELGLGTFADSTEGVERRCSMGFQGYKQEFAPLTAAWRDLILRRRAMRENLAPDVLDDEPQAVEVH